MREREPHMWGVIWGIYESEPDARACCVADSWIIKDVDDALADNTTTLDQLTRTCLPSCTWKRGRKWMKVT